jgi:ABC-type sugar transport system permease subunit
MADLGVIPTVLAIFLAYLLELAPFGVNRRQTLILYPVAMSFVVTGTIWSWMYQPERGVFNTLMRGIGIDSPLTYTNNPDTATYWLIVIFIWQYLGFAVIIVQSSFRTNELQEMVEAAIVDGASRCASFSVILPNIHCSLLVLVSLLINSLKVFDIVWITEGSPGIATDVNDKRSSPLDQRLFQPHNHRRNHLSTFILSSLYLRTRSGLNEKQNNPENHCCGLIA